MRLEESPSYPSRMEIVGSHSSLRRYPSSESPPPPSSASPLVRSFSKATLGSRASVCQSASCPLESHHEGKLLLNATIPLPVDAVFSFMFDQPEFMLQVYADQKAYDAVPQPWRSVDERRKTRTITYTMTLPPSNMGPKVANVTERQVLLPQTQPGNLYVVETEVVNGGIPYADSFYVSNHYCLTKEADGGTKVVMWCCLKYKKNIWGFMKGLIEKNSYSGIEAMMTEIVTHLEAEAEKISNPTGLRRRRATNPYQRARSQKRTDKTVHVANKEPKKADKHETGFNWLIAALLTLLVFVGICNVFLYRRLFYLEDLASNQDVSGGIPDIRYIDKGGSWDDVASILKRQDQMHAKQIGKWSQAIDDASQQLQQVLELLQGIAINIPQHQEKLMAAFIQDSEAHIQDIISEKTSEQGVKVEGTSEQGVMVEGTSEQGGKVEGTSEQDILLERASEEDIRVEITSE